MTTPEIHGPWAFDAQELRVASSILPAAGSVPNVTPPSPGFGPSSARPPVALPFTQALDPLDFAQAIALEANRLFGSTAIPSNAAIPSNTASPTAASPGVAANPSAAATPGLAATPPNSPLPTGSLPAAPSSPAEVQSPSSPPNGFALDAAPPTGLNLLTTSAPTTDAPTSVPMSGANGAPSPSLPSGTPTTGHPFDVPASGVSPDAVPQVSTATSELSSGVTNGLSSAPKSGSDNPFSAPLSFAALEKGPASHDAWGFDVPLLTDATIAPTVDAPKAPSPAPLVYPWDIGTSHNTEVPLPTSSPGFFDAETVRAQFPILKERVNGRPLVWLDNAATTQKPQTVIDRLSTFYQRENSNIHRAAHTLAARATDAYEGARETVRKVIGAPSTDSIVFVRGATEGINLLAQTYGRQTVKEGDEILISWLEHHANIVPWQQLCAQTGAKLRVAPVDDHGQILLSEYQRLLSHRTRIVSFTQVSNALGTITPAQQMIELAHRYGAKVILDGAQGVSHMPVNVQALDCDFYVFSGHKVFGPTGIGAVFGKPELLELMPPWQGGGNMIADVTHERTTFQKAPARFEAGTGNIADAVGLGAALDWLSRLGIHNVERYEHELLEYGTEQLRTVPGLRLIGTAPEKAGVLSFVLKGQKTETVGGLLDKEGIAVRSGHHCAQPILRRFGLEATVRASLAPYNTKDDIDALVAALCKLQRDYAH